MSLLEIMISLMLAGAFFTGFGQYFERSRKTQKTTIERWKAQIAIESVAATISTLGASGTGSMMSMIKSTDIGDPTKFYSKSQFAWLGKWESPPFLTNIRVQFKVYQVDGAQVLLASSLSLSPPAALISTKYDVEISVYADAIKSADKMQSETISWTRWLEHL